MNKNLLNKEELVKIIKITQSIEGYKEPSKELTIEVKKIMKKYSIKV